VITGAVNEKEYVKEVINGIESEFRKRVIDSSGMLSLKQLIELIFSAKMMVTNDSGPMHLAFALETPMVALFGPCSPEQYQISKTAIVIHQNVYCSPCVHLFLLPPCRGDNQCMKKISVERVMMAAEHVLSGGDQLPAFLRNGHADFINEKENH
jgi:ADP-heptose:LPS heptosyltransferase